MVWKFLSRYSSVMATPRFEREKRRLAQAVKRRRIELGMTQEDAAHATHLNTRHYQKLEAGEINVTLRTLSRLAEAFKVRLKDLFG